MVEQTQQEVFCSPTLSSSVGNVLAFFFLTCKTEEICTEIPTAAEASLQQTLLSKGLDFGSQLLLPRSGSLIPCYSDTVTWITVIIS